MTEQRMATSKVAGTWAWFVQRLSAVLLVVLLGIHLYVAHFMDVGSHTGDEALITFEDVSIRLDQLVYIAVDYSMLAMVLLHGLNGFRTVLFDFDMFAKRKRLVDRMLWVVGVVTLLWGIVILLPFITNGG
jgi:succinate dehydrogenase / fumarate reductase membrane anchor subunit